MWCHVMSYIIHMSSCDCIRCTSVDMTRVLRCPTCQQHVFVKGKIETSTFHTIISHTTSTGTSLRVHSHAHAHLVLKASHVTYAFH